MVDAAFTGLTSCRRITIIHTLARRHLARPASVSAAVSGFLGKFVIQRGVDDDSAEIRLRSVARATVDSFPE